MNNSNADFANYPRRFTFRKVVYFAIFLTKSKAQNLFEQKCRQKLLIQGLAEKLSVEHLAAAVRSGGFLKFRAK